MCSVYQSSKKLTELNRKIFYLLTQYYGWAILTLAYGRQGQRSAPIPLENVPIRIIHHRPEKEKLSTKPWNDEFPTDLKVKLKRLLVTEAVVFSQLGLQSSLSAIFLRSKVCLDADPATCERRWCDWWCWTMMWFHKKHFHLDCHFLWVALPLAAHSSYRDLPTERLRCPQLRRFGVRSQFPVNIPTHLEVLIPLQFHNGAVLEGYCGLIRSPGLAHICAKRLLSHIWPTGEVRNILVAVEVVTRCHCNSVVRESLQVAPLPGDEGRVPRNLCRYNLSPYVVELLVDVDLVAALLEI